MQQLHEGEHVTDLLAPYRVERRPPDGDRCWVMANMVGGLDGSAAVGGRVGALSHGADAELFRLMRAVADVVLVGAETVRREGYGPVRLPEERCRERVERGRAATPPLAIVSRSLRLDWDAEVFTRASADSPTMIVTCAAAARADLDRARAAATVVVAGDERVDLADALSQLRAFGHEVVLCEGGPTLLGELAAAGLLDELCLTLSPMMGGDPLPVAITPPGGGLTEFELRHTAVDSGTLFLRYETCRHDR
ncbi:MAG: pyrimidine reductase family protein [Acidimicrobiia bacterium]|nr:pyrimidine reductase family protein [Acidimicrobiia bacterium]